MSSAASLFRLPALMPLLVLVLASLSSCKRTAPRAPPDAGSVAGPTVAAHEVPRLSYLPTVPARTADGDKVGVTVRAKEAFEGLYLNCNTGKPPRVTLQTVTGEVVHEIRLPKFAWYTGCHDVAPHRSGDLLVLGDYSAMRIGWQGEVRWIRKEWTQPPIETHHELFNDEGDSIYALAHRQATFKASDEELPYFHDLLVELDPRTGEVMRTVLDIHALAADRLDPQAYRVYNSQFERWTRGGDPLHTNAAFLIDHDSPPFKKGDLLLSFFTLHELWGVRGWKKGEARIIWRYAPTDDPISPHGPRLMDNGNILYFENGREGADAFSSIREVDPKTNKTVWSWDRGGKLKSAFCGYVQDLPGERFLVSETTAARMTEIDRRGRVLWEYLFRFEGKGQKARARSCRGYKIVKPERWGAKMVALDRMARP